MPKVSLFLQNEKQNARLEKSFKLKRSAACEEGLTKDSFLGGITKRRGGVLTGSNLTRVSLFLRRSSESSCIKIIRQQGTS